MQPVSAAEFDRAMAGFAPFEPRPQLAVGVSGGADSLALLLCADRWAKRRGGKATALTVDHGLRSGSAKEAARVRAWATARGIDHRTLRIKWDRIPRANLQDAARRARYGELAAWCRTHGVVHLAVAHHLDDQAETFVLRLRRGSGVDGLSAMAGVVERDDYRILRPFLAFPKARLVATLEKAGQPWIEDPSNTDLRNARVAVRAALPDLEPSGLSAPRLAATARVMARARRALEAETNGVLGRTAWCHPAGFVRIDLAALAAAHTHVPEEIGLRVLARALMTVSGAVYPPRLKSLAALHAACIHDARPRGRTLAGCRLTFKGSTLFVSRETSATAPPLALVAGTRQVWDGRFEVTSPRDLAAGLRCGALGQLAPHRALGALLTHPLPAAVAAALPAVARRGFLYIGYGLAGPGGKARFRPPGLIFAPPQPLAAPLFAAAPDQS
ncbi:MAG: tRNA lysidine(34) synthetase TilS [Alphaproteobacteria bacterium]|nr:tRNA lysidine(34) synthetase TilS [Alphaproteobacteria bacterium]